MPPNGLHLTTTLDPCGLKFHLPEYNSSTTSCYKMEVDVFLYDEDVGHSQPLMPHSLGNSESLMSKDLSREFTEKPAKDKEIKMQKKSRSNRTTRWSIYPSTGNVSVLFDILLPQIRYGPINFLIAGSKKFLDQLSELPGQQQNRAGGTHLEIQNQNSKLTPIMRV